MLLNISKLSLASSFQTYLYYITIGKTLQDELYINIKNKNTLTQSVFVSSKHSAYAAGSVAGASTGASTGVVGSSVVATGVVISSDIIYL